MMSLMTSLREGESGMHFPTQDETTFQPRRYFHMHQSANTFQRRPDQDQKTHVMRARRFMRRNERRRRILARVLRGKFYLDEVESINHEDS